MTRDRFGEAELDPELLEYSGDTESGEPEWEAGEAEPESGEPEWEAGEAEPESGEPEWEAGEAEPESGEPEWEAGEAEPESGEPEWEAVGTEPESDEPEWEAGEAEPESGEPEWEAGEAEPESGEPEWEAGEAEPESDEPEWESFGDDAQAETGDAELESPLWTSEADPESGWDVEVEAEATPPTRSGRSPVEVASPNVPLGTLVFTPPGGLTFRYRFTPTDALWTARFINGEAGGRDDPENRSILWTMFNRYAFFPAVRKLGSFGEFVRRYSTPLQPYLYSKGAARRHYRSPDYVSMADRYGFYEGTNPPIPKGQLRRFLKLQQQPWTALSPTSRSLALRALRGEIPNPIGTASEFASTYVYYRDANRGEKPARAAWEAFTRRFAASRSPPWRWFEAAPYDQYRRNAVFVNGKARTFREAARVVPPGVPLPAGPRPAPATPPRRPQVPVPGTRPPGAGVRKVVSPLAKPSPFGFNPGGRARRPGEAVYGLVVHTTGSGPAEMEAGRRKRPAGARTAAECALKVYATGKGFPHYLIGYDGTIYATAPEDRIAWHAGWSPVGGASHWKGWTAPAWWSRVWGVGRTPVQLLPPNAGDPNTRLLGVELLGRLGDRQFTDAQYRSLARLVADVNARYGLGIARPPNRRLLGHEDVNPESDKRGGRSNRFGGWDPGAHRISGKTPTFSWQRLWRELEALRGAPTPIQRFA